jgi:hypothetical protein
LFNTIRSNDDSSVIAGFHVLLEARTRYRFDEILFAPIGKTMIQDFHAARIFAQQMNQERNLVSYPEQAVYAGQINAVALIHGITQYLFQLYCEQQNPKILHDALDRLNDKFSDAVVDDALLKLIDEFPPLAVSRRMTGPSDYLTGSTNGKPNREIILEELLMLWLANVNPAFSRFLELFGDDALEFQTKYPHIVAELHEFFDQVATQPSLKKSNFPAGENIIHFLLSPVRASPNSLDGQLAFILAQWDTLISVYAFRLLRGLDLIKEEHKPTFGGGPGPTYVPQFTTAEFEPERFTPDRDWMPNLVMIAKNSYVWLDQLSKKYGREINRLDQIPDEELDQLARWGFTGLWLIGLWERSKASQTIKQRMGNPEAVASAYSLFGYQIAADLGGDEACNDLRQRAWRRGIRLASDMVPNHVGIDGQWVIEHPDWFVSLNYPPFPSYTFNGPNLSWDQRVGIYLEDHYYDKSDAAVVFKRVDQWTGDTRFVYHGNDGTTMPWNDTAQLNYLHPDVREAMIQTILHIARQFPIIRFDAAMTLVKRHFQRLWFPEPGTGGAIPSRAEHGLTKAQFDAAMPEEFWREVVDRAAVEAPDTLLLAEAFWLMEGYFVRTLGMHRVYNSAFMNILRDEENVKYRTVMKNTLEFDPEILKRYVNFMNNPDERTAVDQFGKDGKYFGVCMLMVTMPGLPMFGHAQIEGFAEKYGMDYRRAYWDEKPDTYLIERHEREIFPLMRQRYLFAGVEHFLLHDFYTPDGTVNENVFAYSNRVGDERTLVIYNNAWGNTRGWVHKSVSFSMRTGNGDERIQTQRGLAEGLALPRDGKQFCIFRDHRTGLEYIRNSHAMWDQGLYVELSAYEYHLFLDFRIVADNSLGHYQQLMALLNGRGVPSIDEALRELYVQPVLVPFQELVNIEMFQQLTEARSAPTEDHNELLNEVEAKIVALLHSIEQFTISTLSTASVQIVETPETSEIAASIDATEITEPVKSAETAETERDERIEIIASALRKRLETLLQFPVPELQEATLEDDEITEPVPAANSAEPIPQATGIPDAMIWNGLLSWLFVHGLGQISAMKNTAELSRSWIDEWLLGKIIVNTLRDLGIEDQAADQTLNAVQIMTTHQALFEGSETEQPEQILTPLLRDNDVQVFMGVNRYQDVLWFNKEGYGRLLEWLMVLPTALDVDQAMLDKRARTIEVLHKACDTSDYKVERLLKAVKDARRDQVSSQLQPSAKIAKDRQL